ncbi:hypothetical protein [Escherichia coli]|uniref:hypothetical protein n=1 Tax=Escherichia coli TaxID=562 RepID=UPI003D81BE63
MSGTVESLNTVFVAPQNLSESAANSLLGFCVASALIGCIIGGALGPPLFPVLLSHSIPSLLLHKT